MAKSNSTKAMERLVKAVQFFGWTVAIPNSDDNDNVVGMIVGQEDYVDGIMNSLAKTKWKYKAKKGNKNA